MLHYHTFILFQIESSTFFDHIKYDIYDTIIHLQDRLIVKGSTKDADTLLKRDPFFLGFR